MSIRFLEEEGARGGGEEGGREEGGGGESERRGSDRGRDTKLNRRSLSGLQYVSISFVLVV